MDRIGASGFGSSKMPTPCGFHLSALSEVLSLLLCIQYHVPGSAIPIDDAHCHSRRDMTHAALEASSAEFPLGGHEGLP